jgi:hypothetical protein
MMSRKLQLRTLEPRINLGAYTSSIAGTTLTLTGTDDVESIQVRDDGVGVTILGDIGTTVDGQASATFAGPVNSIKIVAKGGDDIVGLDGTNAFDLPGALDIDLGNSSAAGGNIFNLSAATTITVSLGSVRLKAGDGADTANLSGSPAFVAGNVVADFGNGSAIFNASNADIQGNLKMTAGVGYSELVLNTLNVRDNVTLTPGDGSSDLIASAVTIGGNVSVIAGRGDDNVTLGGTTINGPIGLRVNGGNGAAHLLSAGGAVGLAKGGVSIKSLDGDASISADADLTVTKAASIVGRTANVNINAAFSAQSLAVTGPSGASFGAGGAATSLSIAKNAKVSAAIADASFRVDAGSLNIKGGLSVSGDSAAVTLDSFGDSSISRDVNVVAKTRGASLSQDSAQLSIGGKLSVRGTDAKATLAPTIGNAAGNVTIAGGAGATTLTSIGTMIFGKNVAVSGKNGPLSVNINSRTSNVGGNLTITSGNEADDIEISGIRVNGSTTIRTNGGADFVSLDDGAAFTGPTTIDTGTGDDFLQFARSTGLVVNAVTFTGKATIRAGVGNDQLQLGRSVADGGDGNSLAAFAAGSVVDGGLNLNSFDDETGQFTGSPSIIQWTDPTP